MFNGLAYMVAFPQYPHSELQSQGEIRLKEAIYRESRPWWSMLYLALIGIWLARLLGRLLM
jgi:hypothetical protein